MHAVLFMLLCLSMSYAQYILLEPNAPTQSYNLTKDSTKGNKTLLLKVDRLKYSETEYFLRPRFHSCHGRFIAFIKTCSENCTDPIRPPGPGNFDYIYIQTAFWTNPFQSLCYNKFSKCRNDNIYYIAIEPSFTNVELKISLETFASDQGGEYGIIEPNSLVYLDSYSNVLFKTLEYCTYVQAGGQCEMTSKKLVSNTKYQIYYIVFPPGVEDAALLGNLGTICGVEEYGTPYGEPQESTGAIFFAPPVPIGTKLYITIVYQVTIDGVTHKGTYRPFDTLYTGVFHRPSILQMVYEKYKVIFWLFVSTILVLSFIMCTDVAKWYRDMRASRSPRFIFW